MPVYEAEEWRAVEGSISIPTTPRHVVDIWVSCTKEVRVYGVSQGEKVLLKAGTEFRFRGPLKGFQKVIVEGTGQTPFGLRVSEAPLQDGEPNSGERPPVVSLPEPSNMVLKMRQMSRAHHMANRMPVLDQEEGFLGFSRYEVDDDEEEVLFEEEAFERAVEARKQKEADKKAAEEKARKDAGTKAAEGKGENAPVTPTGGGRKADEAKPPDRKPPEATAAE